MLGVADGRMPCSDAFVIGHDAAVAERCHPVRVDDQFEASADPSRVDRVVVGVDAQVVIARQPGR